MYEIQILWAGRWVTVQDGFKSVGDAEWATAVWKQKNNCYGDPFRVANTPIPLETVKSMSDDQIAQMLSGK